MKLTDYSGVHCDAGKQKLLCVLRNRLHLIEIRKRCSLRPVFLCFTCGLSYFSLLHLVFRKGTFHLDVPHTNVKTEILLNKILSLISYIAPSILWPSLMRRKMTGCYKLGRQLFRRLEYLLHTAHFTKMRKNYFYKFLKRWGLLIST